MEERKVDASINANIFDISINGSNISINGGIGASSNPLLI